MTWIVEDEQSLYRLTLLTLWGLNEEDEYYVNLCLPLLSWKKHVAVIFLGTTSSSLIVRNWAPHVRTNCYVTPSSPIWLVLAAAMPIDEEKEKETDQKCKAESVLAKRPPKFGQRPRPNATEPSRVFKLMILPFHIETSSCSGWWTWLVLPPYKAESISLYWHDMQATWSVVILAEIN